MKKTTTKFRSYLTIDREEQFLNEMCQKGWKPVKIILGVFFKFERCKPGEYIARVTTTTKGDGTEADQQKRTQLIEFLTDSGAEIIPNTHDEGDLRIYAIRPASMGEFEIYTDTESLIEEYTSRLKYHRIAGIFGMVSLVMLTQLDCYTASPNDIVGLCLSLTVAVLGLITMLSGFIPVFKYRRKIKELKAQRNVNE